MNIVILVFGSLISIMGLLLLIHPKIITQFLQKNLNSVELHVVAVVVRFALGFILIFHAPQTRFPLTMEVLGWVAIVAAVFLVIIGRTRFKSLMAWAMGLASSYGRIGGVFAVLFGAFLVYAVV